MRTVAERSTNDRPRRFPLGPGKETAPRIGIPPARSHKHIPPVQRLTQLVEYTKGVRPVIDSIVRGVHVSLPGFRHDSRRRPIEQRARTLGPGPALRIEPARQAKPGRVIREVAIPMIHPDLCGMSKAPLAVPIADQVRGRIDAELPGHRGNHSSWHGRRILEEGPQKAYGGEL